MHPNASQLLCSEIKSRYDELQNEFLLFIKLYYEVILGQIYLAFDIILKHQLIQHCTVKPKKKCLTKSSLTTL